MRSAVGSTIGPRIRISHFDDGSGERAMQRFRSVKTLQKSSSVHAQAQNHFNQERHLAPGRLSNRDELPPSRIGALPT
jgi:putative transposase